MPSPHANVSLHTFTLSDFFVRVLFTLTLVFGTYNPSGRSYLHWLFNGEGDLLILKILVGLLLVSVYWLVVSATVLSLGIIGLTLLHLMLGTVGAALWKLGVFPTEQWTVQALVLAGVSVSLAVGLSLSGIRYRLARQVQAKPLNL